MGRLSLAAERREEILDSYESLIPTHGLGVSFKQIAQSAGMSPSIITHYFGQRSELEKAVTERAVERHRLAFVGAVEGLKGRDRVEALVRFMFGGEWTDLCRRDFHIPALFAEARTSKDTSAVLRAGFHVFEDVVTDLLQTAHPEADPRLVRQTAYALMCLGRSHEDFRAIGFDRKHNQLAVGAARAIVAPLEQGAKARR